MTIYCKVCKTHENLWLFREASHIDNDSGYFFWCDTCRVPLFAEDLTDGHIENERMMQ